MKICSWNINGIRAIVKKGFIDFIQKNDFDIICLQEVKAFVFQIPVELGFLYTDYDFIWHNSDRPGYSGTAIFFKKKLNFVSSKNKFLDFDLLNQDGRITQIELEEFILLNIYFPNGSPKADGKEMLTNKLGFYDMFIKYIEMLKNDGKNILICGDFNICHTVQDIARPKENENSIGFLPIERQKIGEVFDNGFLDVFRVFYPNLSGEYTRWSYRGGARFRNVGRRLDYFVINNLLKKNILSIKHHTDVLGSDHCPLSLEISF